MKDDVSKLVDSASLLLLLLQLFIFSGFPAYEVDTLNHVLAKIVNLDIQFDPSNRCVWSTAVCTDSVATVG